MNGALLLFFKVFLKKSLLEKEVLIKIGPRYLLCIGLIVFLLTKQVVVSVFKIVN